MKQILGISLGSIALLLQCGCSNSSNPTAPIAGSTAESLVSATDGVDAGHGSPFVFEAGVRDDFAAPAEPTEPSAAFLEFAARSWPQSIHRQFDMPGHDAALVHTFTGWDYPVRRATLELHLRAEGGDSENDSVRLGLVGGSNTVEAFRWWMTIHKVTGTWQQGAETVLRLNLADLPHYSTFSTNILSELADGSLELMVEDDTAVDYARLVLIPDRTGARPVALQIPIRPSAR